MSDFEFKPIHKFFKITISSIKYLKNTNSDIVSLHVYNNTPYQVTLPLGLLGPTLQYHQCMKKHTA